MENLEQILKALADKNRLRIVGLLSKRRLCVCEFAHILKISQPSVSKHLKKLKKIGLIGSKQDGLWTSYFLLKKGKLLSALLKELVELPEIKVDSKALKKTDREKLCCR